MVNYCSTNEKGDVMTPDCLLHFTLMGDECVDIGSGHQILRCRDTRPLDKSIVASALQGVNEEASCRTPEDMLEAGEGFNRALQSWMMTATPTVTNQKGLTHKCNKGAVIRVSA